MKKEVKKVEEKADEISENLKEKLQISTADPTIEISKKLKRIRRKLREVEILDEKIQAGEIAPEKDQLEKIARRKKFEEVNFYQQYFLVLFYHTKFFKFSQEINELEKEREKLRKLKPNKST